MCDNFDGFNAPFCSPVQGQQIQVGRTIEVTWDPRFFNSTETPSIFVQADFGILATGSGEAVLGNEGFTSPLIPVRLGRFTWNIVPDYLIPNRNNVLAPTQARLFLGEPSEINITTRGNRIPGPRVELLPSGNTNSFVGGNSNNNGGNSNNNGGNIANPGTASGNNNDPAAAPLSNPIAIALPITFGILTLCFLGFCVWFRRRHPDFGRGFVQACLGRRWRRRQRWPRQGPSGGAVGGAAGGFTAGRSKSQRIRHQDIKVVTTDMNGLRMNAMAMNGDRDRNVFREEMKRQDRGRF